MKKNDQVKPQIHILEASAGSGKTYALAKRYLKLIINPSIKSEQTPVKNILAITFTNKASIEMKTRIFEFLKKIALNSFSKEDERADIMGSLGVPEKEARKSAYALMEYIVGNYGNFRIQTVDSFINEIISGSSFRLGLSSRFDIRTDNENYIARSLDMLIEDSASDEKSRESLVEFIVQYLYIEKKTGWLPKKNILSVVLDLYGKANTYGGGFKKSAELSAKDIFSLKSSAYGRMKKLFGMLPEKTDKRFRDKLMKIITERGENFSVGDLGKYFTREDIPLNKGAAGGAKLEKLWDELRGDIARLSKVEALSFYNCYIDIYGSVMERFETLSRKDDVMFLGELNRRANGVFAGGVDEVPELYYRLSARFKHFLVDEFQDTSVIQWKNMKPMIEEVLSNGGSLFYVGDKKQAIYRFRGGDAGLFDRVPSNFPGTGSNTEILNKNYRSREELVKFNNDLFSGENIERFISAYGAGDDDKAFPPGDTAEILSIYADSRQKPGRENHGGFVSVKYLDAKNNGERDNLMKKEFTALVRSISERHPYGDIAVLARQNDDIELFTGWLLDENIPAESEKTLNLKENPVIKEVVSFLMFLDSPIDDAAFASFLIGDVFAGTHAMDRADAEKFIFETGRAERGGPYLYTAFRESHKEIWSKYFEEFFVSVGFMPVYELVVSVLSRFGVPGNFGKYQGFLSHMLELIKENEKERGSLRSFLEYFRTAPGKDLFVRFSGADSVRLMTIHKAKGLEFPVVVIPYLTMDISALEGRGPSGSYFLDKTEKGLSLVKLNRDYAAYSQELGRLYGDNLKKSLIDELNAVYVAVTRAKDELYIYVPEKSGNKKNAARLFIGPERESGSGTSKEKGGAVKAGVLESGLYGDWIKILKNEFSGEYRPGKRAAALEGEAVHYGLSFIGDLEGADAEKAVSAAVSRMSAAYPLVDNIEALEGTIEKAVKAPALKDVFFAGGGRVTTERELIDKNGAAKRLDRLIEKEDAVFVIDYKSSDEDIEAHRVQLKGYMDLLRGIYPSKRVEGWLVYLDSMTIEKTIL